MTHDDDLTADAFALIEAVADRREDMAAHSIARYDLPDTRKLVSKLLHIIDLRTRVGADIESTAEWACWMRERGLTL